MRSIISFAISLLVFILLVGHSIASAQPAKTEMKSGLEVGANCPAFDPMHLSGPDKGKRACPMCKYGQQQGVMLWVNTEDLFSIGGIVDRLEQEIEKRGLAKMRAFVIFMNPERKSVSDVEKKLQQFISLHALDKVAITFISGPTEEETAGVYGINPDKAIQNTVFIYKRRGVYRKYINLKDDNESIASLIDAITAAEKDKNF